MKLFAPVTAGVTPLIADCTGYYVLLLSSHLAPKLLICPNICCTNMESLALSHLPFSTNSLLMLLLLLPSFCTFGSHFVSLVMAWRTLLPSSSIVLFCFHQHKHVFVSAAAKQHDTSIILHTLHIHTIHGKLPKPVGNNIRVSWEPMGCLLWTQEEAHFDHREEFLAASVKL